MIEQNKHPLWTVSQIEKEVRSVYLTPANLHKKVFNLILYFPSNNKISSFLYRYVLSNPSYFIEE